MNREIERRVITPDVMKQCRELVREGLKRAKKTMTKEAEKRQRKTAKILAGLETLENELSNIFEDDEQ